MRPFLRPGDRSDPAGRSAAAMLGVSAKVARLRDIIESDASDPDLERLLKSNDFQVDRAVSSFYDHGIPPEVPRNTFAPSPLSMNREPTVHRNSRTEQILAGNGQVLNRLAAAQPRFPWAFYDVSA